MPRYLKPSQIAERLEVSPSTVRAWLATGRLPAIRTIGGQYRVDARDLVHLLPNAAPDYRPAA